MVIIVFKGVNMKGKTKSHLSIADNHAIKSEMVKKDRFSIRTVGDQDRQRLASLLHFEMHVHRHLDWRAPLDWIGYKPFLVAERGEALVGALACPPDPPGIAWIRMFAVSSGNKVEDTWNILWPKAQAELHDQRISTVAAIPLQQWFKKILENNHFAHIHNVVLLMWDNEQTTPDLAELAVHIRPMNFHDLPAVKDVDMKAFTPMWQHSLESLELAYKQSAVATVAERDNQVVGYQMSTGNPMGGHLARLAVHPDFQREGVGFGLVVDMLHQFIRKGAVRVTVNTQQENSASLNLYEKSGFRKTNEIYPVYQFRPSKSIG
jgi:ribosomal protein S18 acetylase RimI-like enzyme